MNLDIMLADDESIVPASESTAHADEFTAHVDKSTHWNVES
jgi:hypothetical protein